MALIPYSPHNWRTQSAEYLPAPLADTVRSYVVNVDGPLIVKEEEGESFLDTISRLKEEALYWGIPMDMDISHSLMDGRRWESLMAECPQITQLHLNARQLKAWVDLRAKEERERHPFPLMTDLHVMGGSDDVNPFGNILQACPFLQRINVQRTTSKYTYVVRQGCFVNNLLDGQGKETFGSIQREGIFAQGKLHGEGLEVGWQETPPRGCVKRQGFFVNNLLDGQGEETVGSTERKGTFAQGKLHGHGIEVVDWRKTRSGMWQQGVFVHGEETVDAPGKDRVVRTGDWDDSGNFFGEERTSGGRAVRTGKWIDGKFTGDGNKIDETRTSEGRLRETEQKGRWRDGVFVEGRYQDGQTDLTGVWNDGIFSGNGIEYKNGRTRNGEWKEGNFSGSETRGEMVLEGTWIDEQFTGQGRCVKDLSIPGRDWEQMREAPHLFDGNWESGEFVRGAKRRLDGQLVWEGEWKQGKFTGEETEQIGFFVERRQRENGEVVSKKREIIDFVRTENTTTSREGLISQGPRNAYGKLSGDGLVMYPGKYQLQGKFLNGTLLGGKLIFVGEEEEHAIDGDQDLADAIAAYDARLQPPAAPDEKKEPARLDVDEWGLDADAWAE